MALGKAVNLGQPPPQTAARQSAPPENSDPGRWPTLRHDAIGDCRGGSHSRSTTARCWRRAISAGAAVAIFVSVFASMESGGVQLGRHQPEQHVQQHRELSIKELLLVSLASPSRASASHRAIISRSCCASAGVVVSARSCQ